MQLQICLVLMQKAGDVSSAFIRDDATISLDEMVNNASSNKALSAIIASGAKYACFAYIIFIFQHFLFPVGNLLLKTFQPFTVPLKVFHFLTAFTLPKYLGLKDSCVIPRFFYLSFLPSHPTFPP